MAYEKGQYIVKPGNGICKIEDILHLNMSGIDKDKLYYLLIPLDDQGGKIYVPIDKAETAVRKVMTEEDVKNLINKIPEIEEIWVGNDKLREQRYKEAIRSGNPEELIAIIKTLYLRKKKRIESGKKTLSLDEKYFKMAENNLYSEMGFVLGKEKKEVCQLLIETMKSHS